MLNTKGAQKAVNDGPSRSCREDEQSRTFPRYPGRPPVHPQPGIFFPGDSDLFLRIANGLVVGRADIGNSNPISSPWARTYLFENALSNGNPVTRAAALSTWRGLLGIIAFRRHLGGGRALNGEHLDLEAESVRFPPALAEFVREAKAHGHQQWLTFHILSLGGEPVGGTSPLTLFFPAQDLGRSAALLRFVPWFDAEKRILGDPAEYFSRYPGLQIYRQWLKSWLEHLLRPGILDEQANRKIASSLVRTEIQQWAHSEELAHTVSDPNLVFDAADQIFGDFSLPAIPVPGGR